MAIILQAIAGPDPWDTHSLSQPSKIPDYISALDPGFIKNKRIGVIRGPITEPRVWIREGVEKALAYENAKFEKALRTMRKLGAILVDKVEISSAGEVFEDMWAKEMCIFRNDFKVGGFS